MEEERLKFPRRALPKMPPPSTTNMAIRKKRTVFNFSDPTTKRVRVVVGNAYEREFLAENQPFDEEIALFEQFLSKRKVFRRS